MNSDSDLQIAGDLFEVEHLLLPPREHPGTVAEFAGLARAIAADRNAWGHLVRYDATSRWYHRLRTGPGYEVWLLSWVPGQGSGPHGHGPSAGVLTVLAGELTERTGKAGDRALPLGTQRVYPPGHTHEVVNASLEPAVSLHVYYPGLTEMPMRHVPATGYVTAGPGAGYVTAGPATGHLTAGPGAAAMPVRATLPGPAPLPEGASPARVTTLPGTGTEAATVPPADGAGAARSVVPG